jgi:hypothetical protein
LIREAPGIFAFLFVKFIIIFDQRISEFYLGSPRWSKSSHRKNFRKKLEETKLQFLRYFPLEIRISQTKGAKTSRCSLTTYHPQTPRMHRSKKNSNNPIITCTGRKNKKKTKKRISFRCVRSLYTYHILELRRQIKSGIKKREKGRTSKKRKWIKNEYVLLWVKLCVFCLLNKGRTRREFFTI